MRKMLLLFVALVMVGCQREYGEFIKFHDDGRQKPRVAFLPVIDHSKQSLPWNVSEELTNGMRDRLMHNGNLYLSSTQVIRRGFDALQAESWTKADLEEYDLYSPEHDFVVVLELTDHYQKPYKRQEVRPLYPVSGEPGSVLMMTMLVKVVDIRGEEPKVVLNQYLHSNHLIAKRRMDFDYRQIPWKAATYRETPVGKAHARLERDVVAQLEQYITYHKR